ncbi:MAG: hypothetical protein ABI573_10655 [Chloroflexota bacterium]
MRPSTRTAISGVPTAWQIANTGGSGVTTASALDATGARTAVNGNALTGYLGFDLHGNTALAENGSKTITDALRYDAWGELMPVRPQPSRPPGATRSGSMSDPMRPTRSMTSGPATTAR